MEIAKGTARSDRDDWKGKQERFKSKDNFEVMKSGEIDEVPRFICMN